jgi:hypothetical protein
VNNNTRLLAAARCTIFCWTVYNLRCHSITRAPAEIDVHFDKDKPLLSPVRWLVTVQNTRTFIATEFPPPRIVREQLVCTGIHEALKFPPPSTDSMYWPLRAGDPARRSASQLRSLECDLTRKLRQKGLRTTFCATWAKVTKMREIMSSTLAFFGAGWHHAFHKNFGSVRYHHSGLIAFCRRCNRDYEIKYDQPRKQAL